MLDALHRRAAGEMSDILFRHLRNKGKAAPTDIEETFAMKEALRNCDLRQKRRLLPPWTNYFARSKVPNKNSATVSCGGDLESQNSADYWLEATRALTTWKRASSSAASWNFGDSKRLLVVTISVTDIAKLLVRHPAIVVGQGHVGRMQRDRVVKIGAGLIDAADTQQRRSAIDIGIGLFRLTGDRVVIVGDRHIHLAGRRFDDAAIDQGSGAFLCGQAAVDRRVAAGRRAARGEGQQGVARICSLCAIVRGAFSQAFVRHGNTGCCRQKAANQCHGEQGVG